MSISTYICSHSKFNGKGITKWSIPRDGERQRSHSSEVRVWGRGDHHLRTKDLQSQSGGIEFGEGRQEQRLKIEQSGSFLKNKQASETPLHTLHRQSMAPFLS